MKFIYWYFILKLPFLIIIPYFQLSLAPLKIFTSARVILSFFDSYFEFEWYFIYFTNLNIEFITLAFLLNLINLTFIHLLIFVIIISLWFLILYFLHTTILTIIFKFFINLHINLSYISLKINKKLTKLEISVYFLVLLIPRLI